MLFFKSWLSDVVTSHMNIFWSTWNMYPNLFYSINAQMSTYIYMLIMCKLCKYAFSIVGAPMDRWIKIFIFNLLDYIILYDRIFL